MILSRIPRIVWEFIGIGLLFFGVMQFKGCYDAGVIKRAEEKAAIDSGAVNIADAKDTLRIKDSTVITEKIRWIDVSRGAIASRPGDTTVANLVRSCNQFIVSCESARKAAQAVIDSQDVQIKRLEKMKAMKPPRFSAFAEALYDVPNSEWLARGGVDFRIVGPISVTAVGEAQPKESKARGLVGLRYTFR